MAFRVPTQAPRRQTVQSPPQDVSSSSLPHSIPDDESTQWVLFSPSQNPSNATLTRSASTERPSRLSDFGSFGTPTRSVTGAQDDDDDDDGDDDADDGDGDDVLESLDEDGTELDSLDDGLHAFPDPGVAQAPPSPRWDQGAPAVLPAHDGLGSFMASSQPVQDQLWQHERFNPHHRSELRPRRMSSIRRHLNTVAEAEEIDTERERWKRIEKWRLDQSRAMMQEVEQETHRRRRSSLASRASDRSAARSFASGRLQDIPETRKAEISSGTPSQEYESLWQKITRKLIRDLIGLDDSLLSIILGESLPEEEERNRREQQQLQYSNDADSASNGPLDMDAVMEKELDSAPNHEDDHQQHWQAKLLQRIARELGILIHQFVGHPGAFTTYRQVTDGISNQYAGMPVGRSTERDAPPTHLRSSARTISTTADSNNNVASVSSPHFSPTLHDPTGGDHTTQLDMEDDDAQRMATEDQSESTRLQQEREYWERGLDVMMVFRYLRNRFSSSSSSSNTTTTTTDDDDNIHHNPNNNASPHSATTRPYNSTNQDHPSRRAAIIRQHHPLVAHAHSRTRSQTQAQIRRQIQLQQQYYNNTVTSPLSPQNLGGTSPRQQRHARRTSSSCASQSAKLSSTLSGKLKLSGSRSSCNYWDIGGSVESGSGIAALGAGVGAWGEV